MLIHAQGITKRYGDRVAVDDLSLTIPRGCCFGVLGPNGAGKTTTLRMLYGATLPDAGAIEVFGLNVATHAREICGRLGVTLQDNVLIEALTPRENLRVFGRYHLIREPQLSQRIDYLIDFLELSSHAAAPVDTLSGGFQRRLAIALSLMNHPEILILDEPTTGLDPAVRMALWSKIRELRNGGTTVVITTHYMDEAQRLCDQIAVMASGRMIAQGAPTELIESTLAVDTVEIDIAAEDQNKILQRLPTKTKSETKSMHAGGRMMLYTNNAREVLEVINDSGLLDGKRPTLRPTNLEDLFLYLTGTHLEGGA